MFPVSFVVVTNVCMRKWFFSAVFFFFVVVFWCVCVECEMEHKCKKKHRAAWYVCCERSIFVTIVLLADGSIRIHVWDVCVRMMFERIYSLWNVETWMFELQTVSLWWLFGRCFDQSHIIIGMWGTKLFRKTSINQRKREQWLTVGSKWLSEMNSEATYSLNFIRAIWQTHTRMYALWGFCFAV